MIAVTDPYQTLSAEEHRESDGLAEDAAERGALALSASTIAVAKLAVEAAARKDDERQSVQSIRTDSRFQQALTADMGKARTKAQSSILEAMRVAYATDLHGRAAALEQQSTGLRLKVTVTGQDLADLHDWPIQGHNATEIADYLTTALRWAVDAAMASPLAAADRGASLPGALADVARLHGVRLGNAVSEAYYAAVRKATADLRMARAR